MIRTPTKGGRSPEMALFYIIVAFLIMADTMDQRLSGNIHDEVGKKVMGDMSYLIQCCAMTLKGAREVGDGE